MGQVNPRTGTVLRARAFPLSHTGIDKEQSTEAEIGTISQAGYHLVASARDRPPDGPAHPAYLYTNHRLSTDSNAPCGALNSHVKSYTTIPRASKSGLQDLLFDLQQVQRALRKKAKSTSMCHTTITNTAGH